MRVVLEADGGGGHPLGMLLRDAFFGNAGDVDLLAPVELAEEHAVALGVGDDRGADGLVGALGVDDEVAGVDVHVLIAGALDVQGELDAAVLAVLLAVAVARVQDRVELDRVERDQAEAVREDFIGHSAGVLVDLDQVDGQSRDLGDHDAAERVHHVKLDVACLEVDRVVVGLSQRNTARQSKNRKGEVLGISNASSRARAQRQPSRTSWILTDGPKAWSSSIIMGS